jgi:hypothetical protein
MWQNLSDETRKQIEAAGPCQSTDVKQLQPDSAHYGLFLDYLEDNCDDPEADRKWDCCNWLASKDLKSFTYSLADGRSTRRSESKGELLGEFEFLYGPQGATPITWPSEISGWFSTRDQLEDEIEARRQAFNPDPDVDEEADDQKGPAWEAYKEAKAKGKEWSNNNPVPMQPALRFCQTHIEDWYKAFYDEIARMNQMAMPFVELDTDYIDSLNEVNLKDLTRGQEVKVMGYGTYVLIGQFPPGYENAVMSYDQAWYGALTMKEKGGAFGAGKVSVNGCQGKDQEWFKETFRRVSKKTITFE